MIFTEVIYNCDKNCTPLPTSLLLWINETNQATVQLYQPDKRLCGFCNHLANHIFIIYSKPVTKMAKEQAGHLD